MSIIAVSSLIKLNCWKRMSIFIANEEIPCFIRYAALASIRPNFPFYTGCFQLVLVTYSWRILSKLKPSCIKCKVLDISSVLPMKIPQAGCRWRHCFILPKPCRNFPWCGDVNREKSDVMSSFGLIDRSAVFCVIMRADSSLFCILCNERWKKN
jgi:hypothetical protein